MKYLCWMIMLPFVISCAMTAPKYSTSFDNIMHLRKDVLNSVRIGDVKRDESIKEDVDSLMIRASPYSSPYGTFSDYLKEALRQELTEAKLYNQSSDYKLDAFLLKNELSSGIPRGYAELSAKFVLTKNGKVLYTSTKTGVTDWESYFFGSVAIAEASQNYPRVYKKILGELFKDVAFIGALR